MPAARYQLDPDKVLGTVRVLRDRIGDRLPDSGLGQQAERLIGIGERTRERIDWISQPIWPLRVFIMLLIAALIGGLLLVIVNAQAAPQGWELKDVLELIETAVNDLVMTGIGIFFLVTMETRIKRRRALHAWALRFPCGNRS